MRIAVVSDVVAVGNYLPAWLAYYSEVAGHKNIFLYSYDQNISSAIRLDRPYCDQFRRHFLSQRVNDLLAHYDVVLRVDIDEFLIPHEGDLKGFLTGLEADYVTTYGFNVIHQSGEPVLDFGLPLLPQRRFMYADARSNKTCVTRVPMQWSEGFYACTEPPQFNGLYMMHMKHADQQSNIAWNERMSGDTHAENYYRKPIPDRRRCKIDLDINRDVFNRSFIDSVQKRGGFYRGHEFNEPINLVIPDHLKQFQF
jgi:hypothetical protein